MFNKLAELAGFKTDDAGNKPLDKLPNSSSETTENIAEKQSVLVSKTTQYTSPLIVSAFNEFKQIRSEISALWQKLSVALNKDGTPDFPLLYENEPTKIVEMTSEIFGKPENWYFIGDIHADFFALHTLLHTIKQECPDFRLVFMGDLVDRGEQPVECLFLLLKWAQMHPERIIWLAGNHDIAFSYDVAAKSFVSSVAPSEFLDFLNLDDEMQSFRKLLGEFLVKLSKKLPRAVLFPDGLLATHGGFPLVDYQESAKAFATKPEFWAWLDTPECLQDFTWTRITKFPKKQPNRLSKGCSYGFRDFESFCNFKPNWFPVKRMITGHEHPENGWEEFQTYKINPAVTICGFGFDYMRQSPEKFYKYKPLLVLGRYRKDQLPEKIEVLYSVDELHKFYPLPEPVSPIVTTASETQTGVGDNTVAVQ